jgi:nucleoid-associated protein YgaU
MRVMNDYAPIKIGAISNGVKRILVIGLIIGCSIVLIVGCGPKRPLQEIVDAKMAIQQAKEAGAKEYAPKRLESAQNYLTRALEVKRKRKARELAQEAEVDARIAESMAKRIKEEEKRRAEEAERKKRLACQEAERTIARAQEAIEKAEKESKEVGAAKDKLKTARETLKKERFQEAKETAQKARELALKAETKLPEYHKVKKGETLKIIAQEIYGDPEKWILIYGANKDKIKNANIIRSGQVLRIPKVEK